jgi:hypothetical protein
MRHYDRLGTCIAWKGVMNWFALCERSRLEAKLTFKYDREADILHLDKWPPYAKQGSQGLLVSADLRLTATHGG